MNDFFSRLIEFMSLWGGNEIFGRLGGSLFGWDLKIWEKPVGGLNPLGHCGSNLDCVEESISFSSYIRHNRT